MPICNQGFPIRALRGVRRVARSSAFVLGALIAAVLPNLSGCNAMSSPQEAGMELAVKIDTSKPIRFSTHSFGAHCFDATECRVIYFGRVIRSGDYSERALHYPAGDLSSHLMAPHIGIPNFQAPVKVSWTTMDGTPLNAEIDISDIFKDEIIRHQVPKDQLQPFLYSPIEPDIMLVVRGRTIEIFMRAEVPTIELQIPGNQYSNFRSDLVLVYSHNY